MEETIYKLTSAVVISITPVSGRSTNRKLTSYAKLRVSFRRLLKAATDAALGFAVGAAMAFFSVFGAYVLVAHFAGKSFSRFVAVSTPDLALPRNATPHSV